MASRSGHGGPRRRYAWLECSACGARPKGRTKDGKSLLLCAGFPHRDCVEGGVWKVTSAPVVCENCRATDCPAVGFTGYDCPKFQSETHVTELAPAERDECPCGETRDDFGACWKCDARERAKNNCELCEERSAEWVTGGGAAAETRACSVCVDRHATERVEPGVLWTKLDGTATQCDGMVVLRDRRAAVSA